MNRLSQMHIAQKFILLVSGIAVLVTAIGLYFVYQQEQSKMLGMLEGRGKIIELRHRSRGRTLPRITCQR